MKKWFGTISAVLLLLLLAVPAFAADGGNGHNIHERVKHILLGLAVILLAAKLGGSFFQRFGLPAVLGELTAGVMLGNLYLLNIGWFESVRQEDFFAIAASLGVVVLLFEVGLESEIQQMKEVGRQSFLVAILGVVLPFAAGYGLIRWLLPASPNAALLVGATLTATSVGITARVFKDLGWSSRRESRTVIGAAVIDDILAIIILAVIPKLVRGGSIDPLEVGVIIAKAVGFLAIAILIGHATSKQIGRFFSKLRNGDGRMAKLTVASAFALIYAYLASLVGLEPIIGAFAGGLVLEEVHYKGEDQREHEIEEVVKPVSALLVPIFFVMTGAGVRLEAFLNLSILGLALLITAVGVVCKVVACVAADRGSNRLLIGVGMVPRGEVGLIFATIGKTMGVIDDGLYSALIVMIAITTLIPPPVLASLIARQRRAEEQSDMVATVAPAGAE